MKGLCFNVFYFWWTSVRERKRTTAMRHFASLSVSPLGSSDLEASLWG